MVVPAGVALWFIGFVFRLAIIAVVAVVVFLVLHAVFARRDAD